LDKKEWLDGKSITYPFNVLKVDIWNVINSLPLTLRYRVDVMAETVGHKIVCLPVSQCTVKQFEMAWLFKTALLRTTISTKDSILSIVLLSR
jgi:hypothetical protein